MTISFFRALNQKTVHKAREHFAVKPLRDTQAHIQEWFDSPFGQQLLAAEQAALDQIMPRIYGYHLMQLSVLNHIRLSDQSPVTHHFSLGARENTGNPAVANYEQLPIATESIDAALLHHVLEYSTHPHQLLRETARTIIPHGTIVIVGFNPVAGLSIKKHVQRMFTAKPHWRYHSLGHARVEDWLRVLDFETVFLRYGFHTLPFTGYGQGTYAALQARFLPCLGHFFVIVARKSVVPMTLIRQPRNRAVTFPGWVKGSTASRETLSGKTLTRETVSGESAYRKTVIDTGREKSGQPASQPEGIRSEKC